MAKLATTPSELLTGAEFFEKFPEFKESTVGSGQNRLHQRYNKLIRDNASLLSGARVLDLGSHDGRWSMAALEAGARSVKGLEGRPEMAERAGTILTQHGIAQDRFSFDVGDFHELRGRYDKGEFDVILCLGILYHTPHNVLLFQQLRSLEPKVIILDTQVFPKTRPVFKLGLEASERPGNAIKDSDKEDRALFCIPSHPAIVMMSQHIGYDVQEINWNDGSIVDWKSMHQYRNLTRRSYILRLAEVGEKGQDA